MYLHHFTRMKLHLIVKMYGVRKLLSMVGVTGIATSPVRDGNYSEVLAPASTKSDLRCSLNLSLTLDFGNKSEISISLLTLSFFHFSVELIQTEIDFASFFFFNFDWNGFNERIGK